MIAFELVEGERLELLPDEALPTQDGVSVHELAPPERCGGVLLREPLDALGGLLEPADVASQAVQLASVEDLRVLGHAALSLLPGHLGQLLGLGHAAGQRGAGDADDHRAPSVDGLAELGRESSIGRDRPVDLGQVAELEVVHQGPEVALELEVLLAGRLGGPDELVGDGHDRSSMRSGRDTAQRRGLRVDVRASGSPIRLAISTDSTERRVRRSLSGAKYEADRETAHDLGLHRAVLVTEQLERVLEPGRPALVDHAGQRTRPPTARARGPPGRHGRGPWPPPPPLHERSPGPRQARHS